MTISITIQNEVSPAIANFMERLRSRRPLHVAIGARIKALIRAHVIGYAQTHHESSKRLGAEPSNFVGAAAESVERTRPLPTDEGVSISLNHPFFARAFGDVDIRPRSGLYLTLPLVAQAYNQRAYRLRGLFFITAKSGKKFLAESIRAPGVKAKLRLLYLLVPSVHQTQERGRLPSEAEFTAAAVQAVRNYIQQLLDRKGANG